MCPNVYERPPRCHISTPPKCGAREDEERNIAREKAARAKAEEDAKMSEEEKEAEKARVAEAKAAAEAAKAARQKREAEEAKKAEGGPMCGCLGLLF